MKRTLFVVVLILWPWIKLLSQEEEKKKEMPRLEIPEITIVGKKVITLPFARKGEVLEVELYQAPSPDSSIFSKRPMTTLPIGSFPRFRETMNPLQGYLEGQFGSFSTIGLSGTIRYLEFFWEMSARGGFASTQGHKTNADGTHWDFGAEARATVDTDNEVFRRFRAKGDIEFTGDSYKLFGITDTTTERSKRGFTFRTALTIVDHQKFNADIQLGLETISVEDSRSGSTLRTSTVSPTFSVSAGYELGRVHLATHLQYTSSLLDYPGSAESPTFAEVTPQLRWTLSDQWSTQIGLRLTRGTNSDGTKSTLFSPIALVRWKASKNFWTSFWWEPYMTIASPLANFKENPYLVADMRLRHERAPVHAGTMAGFTVGMLEFEASASLTLTDDTPIHLANNGIITVDYVNTSQLQFELTGSAQITDKTNISATYNFHYAQEDGSSVQLAMIPAVYLQARGDLKLSAPVTLWSTLSYTSPRNVDLQASRVIPGFVLLNAGASSTIIPSALLSFELENVLGTSYEWWSGYPAPVRRFALRLQYTM